MKNNKNKTKHNLLLQRYGGKSMPENILWNSNIELLLSHKSVRKFINEPLPVGTVQTMIAAAQSASNSGNLNQWSVIEITDEELKAKLGSASRKNSKVGMGNPYIEEAPTLLMWVADLHRNSQIASVENDKHIVYEYLDPVIMATVDAALAAQNAVIAAESMGLGIVYLGVMRNNAKEVAELLNLPDHSFVVFGMAVGKPDISQLSSIRPRPSQKLVLHTNGYNSDNLDCEINKYEEAFENFRNKNKMKKKAWREAVTFAVNDIEFMDGRQNLKNVLESKGLKVL